MRLFSALALLFSLTAVLTQTAFVLPASARATLNSNRSVAPALPINGTQINGKQILRNKESETNVSLNLTASSNYLPTHTIQSGFMGLSFRRNILLNELNRNSATEISALSRLFTLVGPGVLRLSGDIAIGSTNTCTLPNNLSVALGIQNLAKILEASRWKVIYGLDVNYGYPCQSTPQLAAAEAHQARSILGSSLIGYEIGNEPEFYRYPNGSHAQHAREFEVAWEAFRRAVLQADPSARIYGPVGGEYLDFLQTFVTDKARELAEVDQHYYEYGAAKVPASVFTTNAPNYTSYFHTVQSIAQTASLPYRVGEINIIAQGGVNGISDAGGSALWMIRYLYQLNEFNAEGFNATTITNYPYSPIAVGDGSVSDVRPMYDAMVFFRMAAVGGRQVHITGGINSPSLLRFASRFPDGTTSAVIINMSDTQTVKATLHFPKGAQYAHQLDLKVRNLECTCDSLLGEATIAPDGTFTPTWSATKSAVNYQFSIPTASAILVRTTNAPLQ